MAEQTVDPAGQSGNGTQASAQAAQVASTTPPEGYVEMSRLSGALVKIEQLTLANRALADASVQKDTTIATLTAKITTMEAEKGQLVGQHKTALDDISTKYSDAQKELAKKQALELKLGAIKASGHPELLAILDSLPTAENAEAQLVIVNQMAQFADGISKKREQELLAGNMDGGTGLGSGSTAAKPTTSDGWEAYIATLKPGSKERATAFDEYFNFVSKPK